MRHLVLMKLENGAFDAAAEADYRATYKALEAALPQDVLSAKVYRNCVAREMNMDVLIELRLARPESLQTYLAHPLHKAIGERYNPKVVRIASFDMEDEA